MVNSMKRFSNLPHRLASALLTVMLLLVAITTATLFNLHYLANQRAVNRRLRQEFTQTTRANLRTAQRLEFKAENQ